MPIRVRLLTALAAAFIATAVSASAAPMIVLYGTPDTNRQIVKPGQPDALPVDGRLHVVEPNIGHLFAGDADKPYRLDHVMGPDLLSKGSGESMAAYLRSRIDSGACRFSWGTVDCTSGLVFIDEIDYRFAEKGPNLKHPAWAGRTSRSQPKRRFPNYVPKSRPGQPGHELSRAMEILAAIPYASGGTYADRVHFFVAPGVVTSVGVGKGPYHNLGRDRRPHFRSHEGLRRAFQLAGGTWLEMYHYDHGGRGRYPFNTAEWTAYPWRFAQYMTAPGVAVQPDPALIAKIHFHMSNGMPKNKGGAPAECANPATPQGCQFALASRGNNARFLANGVGQYRMEGNEAEWRGHVKRLFFPDLP